MKGKINVLFHLIEKGLPGLPYQRSISISKKHKLYVLCMHIKFEIGIEYIKLKVEKLYTGYVTCIR